jgi:hypothetical protein
MAIKRVNSAAVGANNGDTWADAYTTYQAGLTGAGAGGIVLVKSTHAETFGAASQTFTSPGTTANPVTVITTDGTDTVYAASAAANLDVTFATGDITFAGSTIHYGIWFSASDDIFMTGAGEYNRFGFGCKLQLTSTASVISFGNTTPTVTIFNDCELHWSNVAPGTGQRFDIGGNNAAQIEFDNVTITDSGNPTNVCSVDGFRGIKIVMRNMDINSAVWSNTLFDTNYSGPIDIKLINCKVHASLTAIGTRGSVLAEANIIGTDDGTGNKLYLNEHYDYYGSTTVDDANYNNAGATDGTNRISWKVVTNTLPVPFYEFHKTPWITGWINSTGSKTFTVEFNTNNVAIKDDEIWLEVEYLGTAASTQSSVANDRLSPISGTTITGTASGANQASGSSTWTSPGIATDLVQKVSLTATVNRVGPFRARVCVAKASATIWIDPLVTIT